MDRFSHAHVSTIGVIPSSSSDTTYNFSYYSEEKSFSAATSGLPSKAAALGKIQSKGIRVSFFFILLDLNCLQIRDQWRHFIHNARVLLGPMPFLFIFQ